MRKINKIKIVKIFFIITFAFLCVINVKAQHNHGDGGEMIAPKLPPHGGEVKEAGKYKIEMVANLFLKKDQLMFYLYKGNFRAILNKDVEASIVLKTKAGNISTPKLQAKGDDFFVAQLSNTNAFYVTVTFITKNKGKIISAMFMQHGVGHHQTTIFTCSMHPEVETESPGKCPKCGMTLVQKEN